MPEASEPIVVNTGPLIALGACGQIDLLRALHSRIVVPQAVLTEFEFGRLDPESSPTTTHLPEWIEILPLHSPISKLLLAYLDEGEAAVIALALELQFARIVMDERRGRMVAQTMGLAVTGNIGILLRAKRLGMLPAVNPCVAAMRDYGIWLSDRLIASALREAQED